MKTLSTLVVLAGLSAATGAWTQETGRDVDYLALASLMLRDGNYDRAMAALDQVDPQAGDVDLGRYYTLRGMTHLRRNELEPARDMLVQAVETGEADAAVHVYLAQTRFQLEDFSGTIEALDRAGDAISRIPSIYHMRAQSHWLLDDPVMALATLDQAAEIFPGDHSFARRKIFYLVDLGLFRQAAELGQEYLATTAGSMEDHIALGNALRASGELDEAALFLEQARLAFPGSPEVLKVLAHVYIERDQLGAAADLLYEAALLDPSLLAEAAELYRRAGQVYRALSLNGQLVDQEDKLRQRLAIDLELQNFEQAVALETALRRVGLLADEDLRYAMAYALFKTGQFDAAERYLLELTRPDLFRKATELRRAIQDCAADAWKCL